MAQHIQIKILFTYTIQKFKLKKYNAKSHKQ
jgi:hypothetical protein